MGFKIGPFGAAAEQVVLHMQNRYMDDLSLDFFADHTGLSPSFLSKAFKQNTGKKFIDYLTELRMAEAKELLCESKLRISEIAGRVGYQPSYFNRIFKKLEGVSPGQYREASRNPAE